jgi:hypothetical protein
MSMNSQSDLFVKNCTGIASHGYAVRRTGIFVKHIRLFGGLAFLALSASLVAQTHFCIGGDVDHLTPANVAACEAKLSGVRHAVRQQGAPADWHFVVVCDEAGWKEYTSFSQRQTGMLTSASYSTDPRLHWTFLRGSDLSAEQPQMTAAVVTMALRSVPLQKSAPQLPSSGRSTRQYVIAMAPHNNSSPLAQ